MKIEVYYNIHKGCLSIKDRRLGKVISHSDKVGVINPKFVVQPAGRDRVRREKRKNVHAFVRGEHDKFNRLPKKLKSIQVIYNPYKYDTFVNARTGEPVYKAVYALVEGKKVTAYLC